MSREEIVRKIEDFRENGITPFVSRSGRIFMAEYMVSTVIGARRSGKSFRVMQAADEMLRSGSIKSINHICHLDFDNPVLSKMTAEQLIGLPQIFLSITPDTTIKTPLLFIFDEIHVVKDWELAVVELSRNPNWKVIVTGSSSKLLRTDIATQLRGKALSTMLYPLSFSEFLVFKDVDKTKFSTSNSAQIRRCFDEYLKWGSFPLIPKVDSLLKEQVLREYFDTMVLKDVIQRYNISKPRVCIELYYYLLSCVGKPVTILSAFNAIKATGESISRAVVGDWVAYAEDSWLFFTIPVFSDSLKIQERNYKKLYSIDWALAHVNSKSWDGSHSRTLENIIYCHLIRNYHRVNYFATRQNGEVDFIVCDSSGKPVKLVQVCYDIASPETEKRELTPLIAAAKYLGIKDLIVVTLDTEAIRMVDSLVINVVPVWKWLLDDTGTV